MTLGGRKGTSFFPFFLFFLFFSKQEEISFMVNRGIKRGRSFAYISSTKTHHLLCRKHKKNPAAKHENNHQQADPSTSHLSFRYFTMWRILTSSRFLLAPQPAKEMLIFAEETPKWVDTEEGTGALSVPTCHGWFFHWHDNFEQLEDASEEFIHKGLNNPL